MDSNAPLKGQSADAAILSNLIFCASVGTGLFITFCTLRRFLRTLYATNAINEATNTVSRRVPDGILKWIVTVWSITDEEMLPWVGLDGFIYLQTIKLMIGILVGLTIPAICILIPAYYYGASSDRGAQFFTLISVFELRISGILWLTVGFNYYMTILVFWGLYMFHRNLSLYRQAFMYNPASCVSQVSMRRLAKNIGTLELTRRMINYSSRSVILAGVSSRYTKEELIALLNEAELKDVTGVVFVQNRKRVREMLDVRNQSVVNVEKVLLRLYRKMLRLVAKHQKIKQQDLEVQIQTAPRKSVIERKAMLRRLLEDESLITQYRPKLKVKGLGLRDALRFNYDEVIRHDDELIEAANRFSADNNHFAFEESKNGSIVLLGHEEEEDEHALEEQDMLLHGQAVVNWSQFLTWKRMFRDYELNLYGTSMSVIVIFGSQKSAAVASQTLISCRPFSMNATMAPTADDIMWDNLYMVQAERLIRSLTVNVLYVMVNILFTSANVAVIAMLSIDRFEETIPSLAHLFEVYPKLRGILKGILAPLFYNLFLLFAPYMLYGLAVFQGTISKTRIQFGLMQKYTWFLFIQTFVIFICAISLIEVVEKLVTGQYGDIFKHIGEYLPDYAAFFTNIILQRTAISLLVALINPGTLVFSIASRIFFRNNLRMKIASTDPTKIFVGAFYPEYLILVFMITLAFLPLTPIIAFAGLTFYSLAYMVFRYHFIFTYQVPHESGGVYWMFLPVPILVGVIASQLFCILHYSFNGAVIPALFLVPLCIITICGIVFLKKIFTRLTTNVPLTHEGMEPAIKLAERIELKQTEMINEITQEVGEDTTLITAAEDGTTATADGLIRGGAFSRSSPPVTSAGERKIVGLRGYETVPYDFGVPEDRLMVAKHRDERTTTSSPGEFEDEPAYENPYCNPILYKRFPLIYVPPCFFHILEEAIRLLNSTSSSSSSSSQSLSQSP